MPVTDYARSPIRQRRPRDAPLAVLVVGVLVALFLIVGTQLQEPDRVARLTLVNPTDYGVQVSVRTGADSRFDLGWVWEHAERDIADVADVGDTWTFRFRYAGVDAGELTVTRAEIAAVGWRVEIPPLVAERLAGTGLVPAFHDEGVAVR